MLLCAAHSFQVSKLFSCRWNFFNSGLQNFCELRTSWCISRLDTCELTCFLITRVWNVSAGLSRTQSLFCDDIMYWYVYFLFFYGTYNFCVGHVMFVLDFLVCKLSNECKWNHYLPKYSSEVIHDIRCLWHLLSSLNLSPSVYPWLPTSKESGLFRVAVVM